MDLLLLGSIMGGCGIDSAVAVVVRRVRLGRRKWRTSFILVDMDGRFGMNIRGEEGVWRVLSEHLSV